MKRTSTNAEVLYVRMVELAKMGSMHSNVNVDEDLKVRSAKRKSTNAEVLFVRMVEHAKIESMHSNVNVDEDLKV